MIRKTHKIVSVLLATVMFAALLTVPGLAQTGTYMRAPTIVVPSGQTFALPIEINVEAATPSRGAQTGLTWDPTIMSCSSGSEGAFYNSFGTTLNFPMPAYQADRMTTTGVALTSPPSGGQTGNGTFWNLNCQCVADGVSPLTLTSTSVNGTTGGAIPGFQVINGQVTCGAAPGPDVVVSRVVASPVGGSLNTFDLTFDVENVGNEPTNGGASFNNRVLVNGVEVVGDLFSPGLNPGELQTLSASAVPFTGATATVCVEADYEGDIAETDETNNVTCTTFSPVSDSDVTVIECNQDRYLEIVPPEDITCSMLRQLGQNAVAGVANVRCNTLWEMTASDVDLQTIGHMTDWDGAAYDSAIQLTDPMDVEGPDARVTLAAGGPIASGDPSGQVLDAGEDIPVTFYQTLYMQDPILAAGHTYRIVVTFLAYVTF